MNKHLSHLIAFLVLLAVFAVIRFPYDEYAEDLFSQVKENARKQGLFLDAAQVDLQFPGRVVLNTVKVVLPFSPWPIPLHFDRTTIIPRLTSLLRLRQGWRGTLDLYNGALKLSFAQLGEKEQIQLNAEGRAIDLGQHPLLSSSGINGLLAITLDGVFRERTDPARKTRPLEPQFTVERAEASVSVENGSYRGGGKIAGFVAVPAATSINLALKAVVDGSRVTVPELRCFSSLGEVTGTGTLHTLELVRIQSMKWDLTLKLTPQGAQAFGGYFALAARLPVEQNVRNFRIAIEQLKGDSVPRLAVSALDR